jgi:hypothetical protein
MALLASRMANANKHQFRNSISFNNVAFRAFASKIVPVPGMGDSISEGVIETFVKRKLSLAIFYISK